MRLKKKVLFLINDLVINDDGIFDQDPYHVRTHFCNSSEFLNQLANTITNTDLNNIMAEAHQRESILRIIFRLHQYKADVVGPLVIPLLYQHRAKITSLIEDSAADEDLKEMLGEEIKFVDDAIAAPSRLFVINYES